MAHESCALCQSVPLCFVDLLVHTRRGGLPRPCSCPACLQPRRPSLLARAQIELPRDDLYLPTNPASRVLAALPDSATPMQSAAKVPLLVAFQARRASALTIIYPNPKPTADCASQCAPRVRPDPTSSLPLLGVFTRAARSPRPAASSPAPARLPRLAAPTAASRQVAAPAVMAQRRSACS